jgi:leucyl aminopeptidase
VKVITPDDLEEWVSFRASNNMLGRRDGSPEMEKAALWLADIFSESGIQKYIEYPDYIQNYTILREGQSIDERNVIGYIEGSDPELKNEYIIITAHFDHVGVGEVIDGDSIYNGADDNAAGTATLLGIAKYLKLSGKLPGRSLIFAAVSSEEIGMYGSKYIANNPPVSLNDIYVNFNFEMTGHSEDLGRDRYMMSGCSFTNLDELVKEFEKDSPISLSDSTISDRFFFMSDNISFSRIKQEEEIIFGVPSGTFGSSVIASHIHTPSDEVELFDFENMANLVNHFSEMILWLSHCKEPVVWTNPGFKRIE